MPSSIVACHVSQPLPAGPIRFAAETRTPASSTAYWVSDAMVSCCVRLTPGLDGSTRNRSTPSAVRASTTSSFAARANGTCHLVPSSR